LNLGSVCALCFFAGGRQLLTECLPLRKQPFHFLSNTDGKLPKVDALQTFVTLSREKWPWN
jgi:hypothetical protein